MQTSLPLTGVLVKDRNFAMDVMRGVAVLGILLMNITGFAGNEFFLFWQDTFSGQLTTNGAIVKTVMLLFDGRMRGLFTLLFGAGLMLFIENKKVNSIQVADAYFRRMMWLLLFGMIDSYVLLWRGDVLFEYALCGIFVYAFRNLRVRYMLLLATLCIGIYTFIEGQPFYKYKSLSVDYLRTEALLKQGKKLNEKDQKKHDEFQEMYDRHYPFTCETMKENKKELVEDMVVHRSGYLDIFSKHMEDTYEYHSQVFFSIFGESFGMILLGMALYKLGFFHGRFKKRTYWLLFVSGLLVGVSLVAVAMKLEIRTKLELLDSYTWRTFSTVYLRQPGRILGTLAYASLIYLLAQTNAMQRFLNLFANVGRMALTNYIMQTLLSSLFFFGFGFGHYGEYNAKGLIIFIVCIWMIQITYSNIYLSYFKMGPLEWFWKRLTYGKDFNKVEEK